MRRPAHSRVPHSFHEPYPHPRQPVGVEERAAALGKRSIKTTAKRQGILLATSMIDLTTLEGADTPGKVRHLCAKAVCPDPRGPRSRPSPRSASTPRWSAWRARRCEGTGVAVASVSTGFPAGQTSLAVKVEETRDAVAAGATEIDMVISREAYLAGDDARVAHEIEAVKEACGERAPEGDPRDRTSCRPTRTCATPRSWRSTPAPT